MPGCKKFMSLEEFRDLIRLVDPMASDKNLNLVFNSAMFVQVD
jgi:hypothetical protein